MQSAPRGGTPRGALCLSMPSFAENSVKRLDRAQSPRLTLRGDESASPKERRRSGTLAGDGDSNEQSVLQASEFVCLSFGSMSKYAPAAKCRGRVFVRKGGKRFAGAFIRWGERRLCCGIAGEYAASFSAAFAETPAAKSHKSSRGGRAPPRGCLWRSLPAGPQRGPAGRDRRLVVLAAASPRRAGQIETPRGRMRRRAYGAGGMALGRLSPCRRRGCRRRSSSRPDCPVRCEARRRNAGNA